MSTFVSTANGEAVSRASVPMVPTQVFHDEIVGRVREGGRVAAMFVVPGEPMEIWAVVADPLAATLRIGRTPAGAGQPSLTPDLPAVHLYEREMTEQYGIRFEGHPWPKPVRFSPALGGPARPAPQIGVMDFYRVEGEEIHDVAVGPVHAGVIEPGHFRFQCLGEEVLHLEISLGYQHRGVERALAAGPDKRSLHLAETLSGDSTVAHATAWCEVLEGLAGALVPVHALALRGVALELERLANHTGDLGALAGDVGFLPTSSFCGRLRGDWLNLTAQMCGNRFGRGFVRPGGVGFAIDDARASAMVARIDAAMADVRQSIQMLWDTPSVMARFEETGRLEHSTALDIGLVGPAARASALGRDARVDFPSGVYRYEQIPISTWASGDVFARAWVRAQECERSVEFARERLSRLPAGEDRLEVGALRPDMVCVALVEAWRGEVVHVGVTDASSRFAAFKVVDPSFHNWTGLALALRNQQISDFPLINKSFNLSYCGFDL